MLVNFSVGNFRSFKDTVTFSMVAANITAKNKTLNIENVFQQGNLSLLKSAAIYGANASGKSNLLRAFAFMREFTLRSTEATSKDAIDVDPFLLSSETENAPSFFEVVFLLDDVRYRYGFEIDQYRVHTEWLYRTIKRETELFWREADRIDIKAGFKEGKGLEERTRANALFLSVADQWNGEIAGQVIGWFKKMAHISGLEDGAYLGFTVDQLVENKGAGRKITDFVKNLDLGILDIKAEKRKVEAPGGLQFTDRLPEEVKRRLLDSEWFTPVIKTVHHQYNEEKEKVGFIEFDLEEHESEGTKKAFALSGPILHALQEGLVLFVDELDARMHPIMTRYIIELFNSSHTNPHNAQLIFATHDTNLLDKQLLRRDQIWFTEKDRYGATDLYSLVEYNVRYDASFESDYMAGKYGAIPYIGNIKRLLGENYDEKQAA
jgi:uncharacterized protein